MNPGDIAFKSNFATLEDSSIDLATGVLKPNPIVLRRRCDRSFQDWGVSLCSDLSKVRLPQFPEVEVRSGQLI